MGNRRIALAVTIMVAAAYSVVAVPHAGAAERERERRNGSILISRDDQFTAANGVRTGSGSPSDPYVISGWDVFEIHIKDTNKAVVITDNKIRNLKLNWTGGNLVVKDNDVGDLRVNQNVRRTGAPTTGVIARNTFDRVGQLRHFDGVFAHNVVGAPNNQINIPFFTNDRAVNFDGFNGARFFDNTLYGYLEVRLHGHHHSSGYGESSHHHGTTHDHGDHSDHDMGEMVDHTDRFHQVWVYDNEIHAGGRYALVYTDSNHRGNDRTAASEQNEELNKPHSHHTKVHLTGNELIGAGLYVDIFNAKDQNHTKTNRGAVHIADNDITLQYTDERMPFERRDGITVYNAQDVDVKIADNAIRYDSSADPVTLDDEWESDSGIFLQRLDTARVWLLRNFVQNVHYGVRASDMTASVTWKIVALETDDVAEPVAYDSSVRNEPEKDH